MLDSYNHIKMLHILGATLLMMSLVYSFRLWQTIRTIKDNNMTATATIQTHTWLIIAPLALLQLITGFTMISLKHYDLSQIWISGSVIGFIIAVGSWFAFVYFLALSQQITPEQPKNLSRFYIFKRIQQTLLGICAAALLAMIFLMTNKIVSL